MTPFFYRHIIRPILFRLDAETAHTVSVRALRLGLHPHFSLPRDLQPKLTTKIGELDFLNPVGLAAGYDKDALVAGSLLNMGFGFVEVGTVTPLPQSGNPRPRMFRLPSDEAIVNRLGFNSSGSDVITKNMERWASVKNRIGINIGANRDSDDFVSDYEHALNSLIGLCGWFTINISSPNTPGLRSLQGSPLSDLLHRLDDIRSSSPHCPLLFLKVAPDLGEDQLDSISEALLASSFDGLIVSNTTLSRDNLRDSNSVESGGLSGRPLFELSTRILARMYLRLTPKKTNKVLIGVGGIFGVEDIIQKLEAGASMVQLYSGMVYEGPGLPKKLLLGLGDYLQKNSHISEIVGRRASDWANSDSARRA